MCRIHDPVVLGLVSKEIPPCFDQFGPRRRPELVVLVGAELEESLIPRFDLELLGDPGRFLEDTSQECSPLQRPRNSTADRVGTENRPKREEGLRRD